MSVREWVLASEGMTKEEFKRRWESGDDGGGITLREVAEVAIAWGICSEPLTKPMLQVLEAVLAAAGIDEDADDDYED